MKKVFLLGVVSLATAIAEPALHSPKQTPVNPVEVPQAKTFKPEPEEGDFYELDEEEVNPVQTMPPNPNDYYHDSRQKTWVDNAKHFQKERERRKLERILPQRFPGSLMHPSFSRWAYPYV